MRVYLKPLLLGLAVLAMPAARAGAQPSAGLQSEPTQDIRIEVGETHLIRISTKVIRVSVANPSVADVQVVTPLQVLITAKQVGYTHLILWDMNDQPLVIAISVTRNLDQLRSQFAELFPDEEIHVSAAGDLIVLSGTVSDLRIPVRAAEVAQLHADRLANLIQVSGDQQVQLDVRFAEVSRTGMRKAGVNFLWRDSARGYVAGQSTTPGAYLRDVPGTGYDPGPPLIPSPAGGDTFNIFFSTGLSEFPFSAILSILSQEGLAKILAEPTLVATSGQEADFHAGGEVPVLLGGSLGQVSVRFKKFGVRLSFTPTVLSERNMSLKLGIEVSEPDPSAGVMIGGYNVPGFKTRNSETTIRLKDGQSFAIAGLLSDTTKAVVGKVPVLGEIPILGALFSSKSFRREETELLMVVTAHLVRPLTPDEAPLIPGEDEYNDPNDFELFLLGSMSGKKVEKDEEPKQAGPETEPGPPAVERSGQPLQQRSKAGVRSRSALDERTPARAADLSSQGGEGEELEGPLGPLGFSRS
jgi:pilus assembly protein CpaC